MGAGGFHKIITIIWYQALHMPKATAQTLRPRDQTSEVQKTGFSKRLHRHKSTDLFLLWTSKNLQHTKLTMKLFIIRIELGRCPVESPSIHPVKSHVLEISPSVMSEWDLIPFSRLATTLTSRSSLHSLSPACSSGGRSNQTSVFGGHCTKFFIFYTSGGFFCVFCLVVWINQAKLLYQALRAKFQKTKTLWEG